MSQKSLSTCLKAVIIGVGICGLVGLMYVIPEIGREMVIENPEFAYCYMPWMVLFWGVGVPCFIGLFFGWRIAVNIGRDKSFSYENGIYLKYIAWLAAVDSAIFLICNVVFLALNMNHPGILIASLFVVFIGISICIAAACLSHLVMKAAALQEQSDLTI